MNDNPQNPKNLLETIEINRLYNALSDKEKDLVFQRLFHLINQLASGLGMSDNVVLLLDNDILNSMQSYNDFRYKINFIALATFFAFFKNVSTKYKFNILITPMTLYEYFKFDALQSTESCIKNLGELFDVLSLTSLPVIKHFPKEYEGIKAVFGLIKEDRSTIKNEINRINNKKWDMKLVNNKLITLPTYIASIYTPKITTKYFDSKYVELFLYDLILFHVINKNSDKKIQSMMDKRLACTYKVLNIKKGRIQGTGDLNLVSYCDIKTRFYNNNYRNSIIIGLTFDKNLEILLKDYSVKVIQTTFIKGKDNPKEKIFEFLNEQNRLNQVENNDQKKDLLYKYINWIENIFSGNLIIQCQKYKV
ncbi:MAG: hypothetical protein A2014_10745 [Spirochaetes bacterium GWF1_49_6]|nr:MAG: hypothetical protein A2014_10745 [Spirochaetes bacterium GWF1_49_6]